MTTPVPTVPPTDFVTPLLVSLPQQLFKMFTSSPQMILAGVLIIGMLVLGPYLKAKKKQKHQEAVTAKRVRSRETKRGSAMKRAREENSEAPTATAPRPVAGETTGPIHKVMWSPAGNLTLVSEAGLLSGVYHEGQNNYPETKDLGPAGNNTVLAEAERQINEYFAGERIRFNITLKEDAQTFDRNVWTGVSKIPYGETWTAETLTESLGYKPGSATYVSGAVNRNRFAIIIPSHRIVPEKGKGKYVGGTANKDFLLTLEQKKTLV